MPKFGGDIKAMARYTPVFITAPISPYLRVQGSNPGSAKRFSVIFGMLFEYMLTLWSTDDLIHISLPLPKGRGFESHQCQSFYLDFHLFSVTFLPYGLRVIQFRLKL